MKSKHMIKIYKTKTLFICDELEKTMQGHGFKTHIDAYGNLICHRTEDKRQTYYPVLMAHVDTVHSIDDKFDQQKDVFFDQAKGIFWSPQGLGGDDRNGIIIILEILEKYKGNLGVMFFQDEETGGQGSNFINTDEFTFASYAIAIDRKERHDIIFEANCTMIATEAFKRAIKPLCVKHKLKSNYGLFTDAVHIAERARISCINLSAGYYNPHSNLEYSSLQDMRDIRDFVLDVIKQIPCNSQYENNELYRYATYTAPNSARDKYEEWRREWRDYKHYNGNQRTNRYQRQSITDAKCPSCFSWVSFEDGVCIWCGDTPDEFMNKRNFGRCANESLYEGGIIE